MHHNTIHLVGFGSQGSAWAQCLRSSGWDVQIYLSRKGRSFELAEKLGFSPFLLSDLNSQLAPQNPDPHWLAFLCPDDVIAPVYRDYLQSNSAQLRLILAHGYVIYSRELQMAGPHHQVALLAPKAIGPKLLENFQSSFPQPHRLAAAYWTAPNSSESFFHPTGSDEKSLIKIAQGLGFAESALIHATFEQEAVGDLISEQGLLCGGIFNLLELTLNSMQNAGIPEALIREECITELELVAGLIRERGLAQSFQAISQAAQCGTISMAEKLEKAGLQKIFEDQAEFVKNGEFVEYFRSQKWQEKRQQFTTRLSQWEERFKTLSNPGADGPGRR